VYEKDKKPFLETISGALNGEPEIRIYDAV
jgi:hypothetical protein